MPNGDAGRRTIAIQDKEKLVLRDGDRWCIFPCAWGATPPSAFLQPAGTWDEVMPDWLHGQRDEVVTLVTNFGHVVHDDDQPIRSGSFGSGSPPLSTVERVKTTRASRPTDIGLATKGISCPMCGGELVPGTLGGGWFTWIPRTSPIRWTMVKNMFRPSRQFGRMRWPFWSADAARCADCDMVVTSTRRGRKGQKRMT